MNDSQAYTRFGLARDMLETSDIIARFDCGQAVDAAREIAAAGKLLLTGEGSSRLFPAKSTIAHARRKGWPLFIFTEAGRQSQEYDLRDWAVLACSNSGRTAEVIRLFTQLSESGHRRRYSLTALPGSKLESLADCGWSLSCGPENAVAATKSVVEQALFIRALVEHGSGAPALSAKCGELTGQFRDALTTTIDPAIIERVARAGTIYWAGRNDGVAEELTLKTNEITRKPADFLEGTYAVHGIEEVMTPDDVLLWVDPYEESEEKFDATLRQGVGMEIVAIAARPTRFPTIRIPDAGDLSPLVQIAAGWNVLVDVGLRLGIDLDKPQRARKVGNEFAG